MSDPARPPEPPKRSRLLVNVFAAAFGLSLLVCIFPAWTIQVPFHLTVGWTRHIRSVAPEMRINWSAAAMFAAALLITAALAHYLARWLWTGLGNQAAWRLKWTLLSLATVMLMFVAGVAATGVVHQAGWLMRSQERLTVSGFPRRNAHRVKCATNLRQIGRSLAAYATNNNGYRAADRADLIRIAAAEGARPEVFVCPADFREAAPGTQPTDWVPLVSTGDRHSSYVFVPPTTLGPDGTRYATMYDIEPHDLGEVSGVNVLYVDGSVEWVVDAVAKPWLARLPAATTQSRR